MKRDPRAAPISIGRVPRWDMEPETSVVRLFRRFDDGGSVRPAWFFSSLPTSAGRFDLPAPMGTCYFASTPVGAWLEVFGAIRVVAAPDVRRRQLATATRTGGPLSLVDLTSPAAAAAGVTLDVQSGADYALPQQVAVAAEEAGAAGVRALARHDPSGTERTVAIFGRAGAPRRQFGWRVTRRPVWGDVALMKTLAARGIVVRDIPHDLPVTPPPAP